MVLNPLKVLWFYLIKRVHNPSTLLNIERRLLINFLIVPCHLMTAKLTHFYSEAVWVLLPKP